MKETIKDKIQQIFKFLEIADVSQWQGMNVFEASEADSLYGILETALEQTYNDGYENGQNSEALLCNDILRQEFENSADFEKLTKAREAFKEALIK